MHLKSLDIYGFKSFAEKVTLTFLPPQKGRHSVTAIVGPNGSGKSNIADAIRWVLGEQRLKTLRGKKSEDVIFSGSDAKGRMSLAAVTMTIDNTDHRLPIEYDELVMTRRIYRTGESEYLVNGSPVRLIDLQLLLARAQFGHGSYSVIGQGMIDRLLLQTPDERKDFFDEAFGIKEFQLKRHQAILKLARTKEHIHEAEVVLAEVTPRLKSLSRQVKKLEERQAVEQTLREAQELFYTTLWGHHDTQLEALRRHAQELTVEYNAANTRLQHIQEELAQLAKEASRHEVYQRLQSQYQDVRSQRYKLEEERAALQGRMQVEYSKVGKQQVGWLEKQMSEVERERARLGSELEQAKRTLTEVRQEGAIHRSRREALTLQHTELRSTIASLESRFTQAKQEESVWHITGLAAVQAILAAADRFTAHGRIFGVVAQLATVDDRYLVAMDVAAAHHLASLVVENDAVAEACIRWLREEQLGVATFLPLNKIKPRFVSHDIMQLAKRDRVHGLANELARHEPRFSDVFSYVFGNTLIIDDVALGREIGIGRTRMVTIQGDVLEMSGSMKGGYRRERATGMSFARVHGPYVTPADIRRDREEIQAATSALATIDAEIEKIDMHLREADTRGEVGAQTCRLLEGEMVRFDRDHAALEQELSLASMSPDEYGSAMRQLENVAHRVAGDMKKLDAIEKEAERAVERFHEEEEAKKRRIFALQDAMHVEQGTVNQVGAEKNELHIQMAKIETKQEDLANEVFQELHTSIESIMKRGVRKIAVSDVEVLPAQIQKLKYQLTLIGGIDEVVVAEYEEAKTRHDTLTTQLDDLGRALTDLETLVEELDGLMKKRRSKAFALIRKEFQRYFRVLFDGGKADLVEVYEDQTQNGEVGEDVPLDEEKEISKRRSKKILAGVDIIANPPGKKITLLQALSGGERTLTSIALICAILHTNPPPFVILDEVEAALDETNTLRFTQILHELAEQSQFVFITHNRVTMHAADVLYGVTMGNDGMSRLLSVQLSEAKEMPAA